MPAQDVIASTTVIAARLLRMEGKIGTLAPRAFGDLVVVDGDPLQDLSVLAVQGDQLSVIVKGGMFVKHDRNRPAEASDL